MLVILPFWTSFLIRVYAWIGILGNEGLLNGFLLWTGVIDRPLTILDVGCGTGIFAARIHEALPHAKIWGVDLVAAMLAGGRSRWRAHRGHVAPVQGDSERLPFPEGAFDVVTCANSFHHYPHQQRAVEEMYRVLKPGGRLITPPRYSP